jgi:hypothetical protein
MRFRFTINTITFLVLCLVTVIAWIGFEYYHRQNNFEVGADLIKNASTPLPTSFDTITLKKLYTGKDNFYEVQEQTNTAQE